MENGISIKNGITIPEKEIEIITSRAGGKGGQHVNKTETKITLKWSLKNTQILDEIQKNRVLENLKTKLTKDGELIIHNSESRSQQQNKNNALKIFAQTIRKALHIPKKRMRTRIPKKEREHRLKEKSHRSEIKKLRKVKIE